MNHEELLALHRELVRHNSVSHGEGPIADWVEGVLRASGARVERWGDNVLAFAGTGPKLLLNSHLDTVPPGDGWQTDPWTPTRVDGKLIGLGSNDAKAPVAAMIDAFLDHAKSGENCEVCLMLVPEEETGGKGTEFAWPKLRDEVGWHPEGAVVGEPTELQIGTDQKGMMVLELVASGTACHAANAKAMGVENPVWMLARDLTCLSQADLGPDHPELGPTTLEPTVLKGASARNQIAEQASAVIDVRTLPGTAHADLHQRLSQGLEGELLMRSIRLEPYQCPRDAKIVRAAMAARSNSKPFSSPTMSDQVFLRGVPAIKCGPGISARSHTANEFVLESELIEGATFYRSLIRAFGEMD